MPFDYVCDDLSTVSPWKEMQEEQKAADDKKAAAD
jgi:hypothetical protein